MRIKHGVLALSFTTALLSQAACSGKDDKEAEEPAGEATEGEPAEPPAEAPAEETPAAEPAPEAAAPTPPPAPSTPAEPAGFEGAHVTKYVTSYALNVRTGPGKEFPVKRHVKRGDKLDVVINGEWAKLGSGEYISINRLSDTDPGASKAAKGKAPKAKKKK